MMKLEKYSSMGLSKLDMILKRGGKKPKLSLLRCLLLFSNTTSKHLHLNNHPKNERRGFGFLAGYSFFQFLSQSLC